MSVTIMTPVYQALITDPPKNKLTIKKNTRTNKIHIKYEIYYYVLIVILDKCKKKMRTPNDKNALL